MPRTVQPSFDKFRENIEFTGQHREIANNRKGHVISLLENDFSILEAFPSGSILRHTAVRGHINLDVIVVLHYGKHIKGRRPSQVLRAVRECLSEYKTNVRKNGQAVTLYYDTWPNVDIIPVSSTVNDNGSINHYEVPDVNTESWLPSRPKRHSVRLNDKSRECGEMFKRIIEMIKWWNHQHGALLQSFHIEVMAIEAFRDKLSDYPGEVFRFFDKSVQLASAPLWYEVGSADSYLSSETRQEILGRLEIARDKAREACYLTQNRRNEHEKAIHIWRLIFGDKFPAYDG